MKNKTTLTVILLLQAVFLFSSLAVATARAQTQDASSWVKVSPAEDEFTVLMPQFPIVTMEQKEHGKLSSAARVYTVTTQKKAIYTIWSLTDPNNPDLTPDAAHEFLDACAELIWDEQVKPKLDNLRQNRNYSYGLAYVSDIQTTETNPGREYLINLGPKRGLLRLYYNGPQVFVIMARNVNPAAIEEARQFVNSFALKEPAASRPAPDKLKLQIGPPATSPAALSPREVTQKARILSRPEPHYTEEARKFQVSGTVVLKAVLSSDGQVSDIHIIRRLPHGLTQTAVNAARQISFQPAVKDGRPVSQFIQIEYNYNLY